MSLCLQNIIILVDEMNVVISLRWQKTVICAFNKLVLLTDKMMIIVYLGVAQW